MLAAALLIASAAFQNKPAKQNPNPADTLPDRHKQIRDIDAALEELERGQLDIDRSLKEIDFAKIEKQINEATQNIRLNQEEIKAQIEKAMQQVDAAKIQAQLQGALKEADAAQIKADVDKSIKEIDFFKIKTEINASIAKIDWDKLNEDLGKVKNIDMEKVEADLKKIKPEVEKSIKKARKNIENAKEELKAYKGLIDGLDKEGLINKKENYTIEYKKGTLTINGKKQPADLVTKYQNFLQGRKDFTITKEKDDFHIDHD